MKRVVSLMLVVCLCLSLAFTLTSCFGGGEKNAWQEYLLAKGWNSTYQLESETGTVAGNNNGYSLTGLLKVNGRGYGESFRAEMMEKCTKLNATDGLSENDEYRYIKYDLGYSCDDNVLYLNVTGYMYQTDSCGDDLSFDWADGIRFINSEKFSVQAEFDMSKYFENGTLALEDATITEDFEIADASDDLNGLTGLEEAYSQRNAQWKSQAWNSIIASVNKTIELMEAHMESNPV